MTAEDLAISLIVAVVGVISSYLIARHFYIKDQRQKREARKRSPANRKPRNDPLTIKLDPNKPNLGLTETKVKNTLFALAFQKLFFDNDRNNDAI